MNNILHTNLFLWDENCTKETLNCLIKLGFNTDSFKKADYSSLIENELIVEFKKIPLLLQSVSNNNETAVSISSVSENGITFYVINQHKGDSFLFVPMNNISAISTKFPFFSCD